LVESNTKKSQDITLSEDQTQVFDSLVSWLYEDDSNKPLERTLGGYAGTGKTTLIKKLIETNRTRGDDKLRIAVAAFTGKAAFVLQSKGIYASTLHRLLYDVRKEFGEPPTFQLKHKKDFNYDMIIVDEASMISAALYKDLAYFQVPILFVGDMGQLEPIGDNPNIMASPDLTITKIHRQAEKSAIIMASKDIREGKHIADGTYNWGEVVVTSDFYAQDSHILDPKFEQIICAKNATRVSSNTKIRTHLGYPDDPVVGDRLICLKNNYEYGVFNGMIAVIDEIIDKDYDTLTANLLLENGEPLSDVLISKQYFNSFKGYEYDRSNRAPRRMTFWDFGYAITCHKSQGSEWDNVLVLVESLWPGYDVKRWLYTAVTRASNHLTICT